MKTYLKNKRAYARKKGYLTESTNQKQGGCNDEEEEEEEEEEEGQKKQDDDDDDDDEEEEEEVMDWLVNMVSFFNRILTIFNQYSVIFLSDFDHILVEFIPLFGWLVCPHWWFSMCYMMKFILNGWIGGIWKRTEYLWNSVDGSHYLKDE